MSCPCGSENCNAPSAGHEAMQAMHAVHSELRICTSLSTARLDGHACEHLPQSMHAETLRRIFSGESREARPISAPYGHRYRHHTFSTTTDKTISAPMMMAAFSLMSRKK